MSAPAMLPAPRNPMGPSPLGWGTAAALEVRRLIFCMGSPDRRNDARQFVSHPLRQGLPRARAVLGEIIGDPVVARSKERLPSQGGILVERDRPSDGEHGSAVLGGQVHVAS